MQKLRFTFILIFSIAFSFISKGQIINHVDSLECNGTVIFELYIGSAAAGGSFETSYGDGIVDVNPVVQYGSYWYAQSYHTYATFGNYTIKRVLINASNQRVDSVVVAYDVYSCRMIGINLFQDLNANCIADPNELVNNGYLNYTIQVDSNGIQVATLGPNTYWYKANGFGAATYTFTLTNISSYVVACPANGIVTINVPANQQFNATVNFGLTCSNNFDIGVATTSHYKANSTGYPSRTAISAFNYGCTPTNGQVVLNFSPKYNFHIAWPTPASVVGHTVTWNVSNLGWSAWYFYVEYDPTPGLQLGDTVHTDVTITPITGDAYPANNTFHEIDSVAASWDPNDKKVSPSGNIHSGDALTYTIEFENTGQIAAQNIHILDTLSDRVDVSSLKLLSSTHNMKMDMMPQPNGTTLVKFEFANINLPDASQPNANKGFVVFKVNSKTGLPLGSTITNNAYIFFDYNPAVMTNTVVSTIGTPQGIEHMSAVAGGVYPNPVTRSMTINNPNNGFSHLQIVNSIGQTVIRKDINVDVATIDVSQLVPGLYYVVLNGKAGTRTEKIEKK